MIGVLLMASGAIGVLLMASGAAEARMWTSDAEHSMSQEWTSLATAPACEVAPLDGLTDRVQRVTRPVAQGRYAYRFEIRDNDFCVGARSELANSQSDHLMYPSQERWISLQAYFPDNYQLYAPANYRTGLMQLKQVGSYSQYPAISMSNGSGYLCVYLDSRSERVWDRHCGAGYYDLGRPARNRWVQLTFHILFEGDRRGFLEACGDLRDKRGYRRLTVLRRVQTLTKDGATVLPSIPRLGIYRSSRVHGTEDLYVDGFTVASGRATAEKHAFGRVHRRTRKHRALCVRSKHGHI
jgi:polysaccharide lyase-like protein